MNENLELNTKNILYDDLFVDDIENEEKYSAEENIISKKDSKYRRKRNNKKKSQKKELLQNNLFKYKIDFDQGSKSENLDDIDIELIPEEIHLDKHFLEFSKIFDYFKFGHANNEAGDKKNDNDVKQVTGKAAELERLKARIMEDEEEEEREKKEGDQPKLSKKKLKLQTRLSVAALKQLVNRPDVVEMYDVTARDPKLLVHLKATRNTVPVPRHWCAKRKYLQGKRGFEKPPFELPEFIKRTGIQSMREAVQEKDKNKSLKQKMREKVRPKMGRIDIDYQKLHDAFFRWQTKPKMTIHGDLYYEGKELEAKLKEKKPGNLTDDLRIALGMPTGPTADKVPPPWLIAMQRYGPPPSYPSLKIPGLNAPIPEGCSFGYHAGGWGKPPVDEFGRPLYGDVFGSTLSDFRKPAEEEAFDPTLWGEMEEEFYEEIIPDEEEEEDTNIQNGEELIREKVEEDEQFEEISGLKTPGEGLMTPSGISTTVSVGLETPDMIELRKRKTQIESDMESTNEEMHTLYKVIPEKTISVGSSMMGSSKIYDLTISKNSKDLSNGNSSTLDLSLNPDELDNVSDVIQSSLDQHTKEQSNTDGLEQSDLKQKRKRKTEDTQQQKQTSNTSDKEKNKKYKEFKF